jgi:hypothetical protein
MLLIQLINQIYDRISPVPGILFVLLLLLESRFQLRRRVESGWKRFWISFHSCHRRIGPGKSITPVWVQLLVSVTQDDQNGYCLFNTGLWQLCLAFDELPFTKIRPWKVKPDESERINEPGS